MFEQMEQKLKTDKSENRKAERAEKQHQLYTALREAREHPGLSLEELAQTLVDGLGIDAKYLVGPLKVILKREGKVDE